MESHRIVTESAKINLRVGGSFRIPMRADERGLRAINDTYKLVDRPLRLGPNSRNRPIRSHLVRVKTAEFVPVLYPLVRIKLE